jgi:hypothetical protein
MFTIRPGTQTKTFSHPGPVLHGRRGECDILDRLIARRCSIASSGSRFRSVMRSAPPSA